MSQYRYILTQITTNTVLAELPLTGVQFNQTINSAGAFQGYMPQSDPVVLLMNVSAATVPGACAIYVDRDGVLIWGGVIWSRTYESDTQRLTIRAQEFESYFAHRRITTTQVFNNVDQLTIAQTLITQAQAATGGNIGVVTRGETSGVLVSRTFYGYELKPVLSALQDLSKSTTGFDFAIKVAYDGGGRPALTLWCGYPRLGTAYSSTNQSAPVFEFPAGNVISYEYPEDGSAVANVVYALGAGSNEGKLISTATDATKLAAGYPLLETSTNYTDIYDSTLLGNLAAGQIKAVSSPPVTIKLVVAPYVDPVLGSYNLGDDVRLRIQDDRFPNGLDATYRIMGIGVAAGENNSPERVTLNLTLPQV